MAELVARVQEPPAEIKDRWDLPIGLPLVIGRSEGTLAARWDNSISRFQAEVLWDGKQLTVRRHASGHGTMEFEGRASDGFAVRPGRLFKIGRTWFEVIEPDKTLIAPDPNEPAPRGSTAFTTGELVLPFADPALRLELLRRLPAVVSESKAEYLQGLAELLHDGLPRAVAVLLVAPEREESNEALTYRVLAEKTTKTHVVRPSHRLIREAVAQAHTVYYEWPEKPNERRTAEFTVSAGVDWAFCTPLKGDYGGGRAIYVAGRAVDPTLGGPKAWDPRDDVKFADLVASYVTALRQNSLMSRRQAVLGQFFSPSVMEQLASADVEKALEPREVDVSVLFCDLRGFSKASEKGAADLMGLLRRVGDALGLMTRQILDRGGVIGDFQGDSAMGLWGWPVDQPFGAAAAVRTAMSVRQAMEAATAGEPSPLGSFRMGIGLASGRAVAGRIGTPDQAKVSVFGPVVNLASRLEGMTKHLRVPILMDHSTADAAGRFLGPDEVRFRRVAKIRPFGLDDPVDVFEAIPPVGQAGAPAEADLDRYGQALAAFEAGDWLAALNALHATSAAVPPRDFLRDYITSNKVQSPSDWSGVIAMTGK